MPDTPAGTVVNRFLDARLPGDLRLVDSIPTSTGVIIATYEPAIPG
ncbi:MAG: hypothetical protein L0Y54_09525 [Sporichthyaceae bacterium]|nr:hypothetical protein [Sporichthyaceae bacterium]